MIKWERQSDAWVCIVKNNKTGEKVPLAAWTFYGMITQSKAKKWFENSITASVWEVIKLSPASYKGCKKVWATNEELMAKGLQSKVR